MALPEIQFDTSSGSDSAASGAGPASALSGTGASLNATTTVDLSADSPDLSGVATDGSAALWVGSSSGRQFGRITAVNNSLKTVTVHAAYAVTESSRNWGIGGKRNDLDAASNRRLFNTDAEDSWHVVLFSDQTITSQISDGIAWIVRSDTPDTLRTITQTGNTAHFRILSNKTTEYRDLKFLNSNGTKTAANALGISGTFEILAKRCIFGDPSNTNNLGHGIGRVTTLGINNITFIDCAVINCIGDGIFDVWNGQCSFIGCLFNNNQGSAFDTFAGSANENSVLMVNCIISNNTSNGITNEYRCVVIGSVIHGNTLDGINNLAGASVVVLNSCLTKNGNYGIRGGTGTILDISDYNCYGSSSDSTNNTSGDVLNMSLGDNDLSNTSPQYTDAANLDFSIGTNLKEKGVLPVGRKWGIGESETVGAQDIGPQRVETGGGTTVVVPRRFINFF